jgi:hypothetical protein
MRRIWFVLRAVSVLGVSSSFAALRCEAASYQSNGSVSSVQALLRKAHDGDTITIPSGTFTWSNSVTISKAIKIQGAGSGRIIGRSRSNVAVGTGSKTFATQTGLNISGGDTLRIESMPLNNGVTDGRGTWMQGTVTSYSGTSLTMNVTTSGGSGTHDFWKVERLPATTLAHALDSNSLFVLNESTSGNIDLSGIRFTQFQPPSGGNGQNYFVELWITTNGKPIFIHDCWFSEPSGNHTAILVQSNQGVIWNCSIDAGAFGLTSGGITQFGKAPNYKVGAGSWTNPSMWGNLDTTGTGKLYVEDCDFHAMLNATSNDNGGKFVIRHCVYDNAGIGSHGADSSDIGMRYFEIYDSEFVFNSTKGDVLNLNYWVYLRGGTFVLTDCIMPLIQSQDYGTKPSFNFTVMNLQRNSGPNPCWGAGTSGGAKYPAPRQVGMGRVTGNGHDGLGRTNDSVTYVGDSEPIYVWNITGPTPSISTSDYGGNECSNPDHSSTYIRAGRDYFVGTPKPGYKKFVYPHPLSTSGSPPATAPSSQQQIKKKESKHERSKEGSGKRKPTIAMQTNLPPLRFLELNQKRKSLLIIKRVT